MNVIAANPQYEQIPAELRQPALWLQYYLSPDPKKPDKKPRKHPEVKYGIPEERTANLRPLDYLIENRRLAKNGGYQRYIDPTEGFVFLDLDHVRDLQTGELKPWASELVDRLDTYTEISASGEGLHLVARGTLPRDFKIDTNPVEIYSGHIPNKLLAVTGNVLDLQSTIKERQAELEEILARAESGEFGPGKHPNTSEPTEPISPPAATWPEPMAGEAFYGLAGDFVRLVEPETEADRVALLGNFLIAAGVLFGREAWVAADGKRHFPVEYLLMAGSTGTGRKGTATGRVLPVLESCEECWKMSALKNKCMQHP